MVLETASLATNGNVAVLNCVGVPSVIKRHRLAREMVARAGAR
jgi:hypothetical protein